MSGSDFELRNLHWHEKMYGHLTPISWLPPRNSDGALQRMKRKDWGRILSRHEATDESIHWWLGDLILYGERRQAEAQQKRQDCGELTPDEVRWADGDIRQELRAEGMSNEKIRNYVMVARAIEPEFRATPRELSWSAHRELRKLEMPELKVWIDRAVEKEWSTRDVIRELHLAGLKMQRQPAPQTPMPTLPSPPKESEDFDDVDDSATAQLKRLAAQAGGFVASLMKIDVAQKDLPLVAELKDYLERVDRLALRIEAMK